MSVLKAIQTAAGYIACGFCWTVTDISNEDIKRGLASFKCDECGKHNALDLEKHIWPVHGIKSMKGYSWG